ncbi:B-cell scaffold protein with ankyrin repeats [Microtus ochrogaster]|uniref:B-cell scaffold protein with ankyrin repeats n=1 Tax=Microtus ochrogaster TaxID=79684 RepID=A0A8J6KJY5_MICOH|nr:B-cell scaffold protein with ankyrin repeats [Microtus ochrogaster]
MKALDFPAGSVTVEIHCDGIIKATTEIKYYSAANATESPFRMSDPGKSICQKSMKELDGVLASLFKHEIPHYEFKPLQTETYPPKEYTHARELPTLLHCAAKFGLKNLALHLLQCSGATWAARMKNMDGSDMLHLAERHGHEELRKILEDVMIQNINRNNEQGNDYEEDVASFSTHSPSTPSPAFHHELCKTHRQSMDGSEEPERAGDTKEEPSAKERPSLPEVDGVSSENQYDDLYVFIPGTDSDSNSQEPVPYYRPPLPPPRPGTAASQLERPHFTSQGFLPPPRHRDFPPPPPIKSLSLISLKSNQGSLTCGKSKDRPPPSRFNKARMEGATFSSTKGYLTTGQEELILGQEELILLQEKVKNGEMSVDEALEKFKRWQMGKSGLEIMQQEKLRQLRDNIIGKRPEDENACGSRCTVQPRPPPLPPLLSPDVPSMNGATIWTDVEDAFSLEGSMEAEMKSKCLFHGECPLPLRACMRDVPQASQKL